MKCVCGRDVIYYYNGRVECLECRWFMSEQENADYWYGVVEAQTIASGWRVHDVFSRAVTEYAMDEDEDDPMGKYFEAICGK